MTRRSNRSPRAVLVSVVTVLALAAGLLVSVGTPAGATPPTTRPFTAVFTANTTGDIMIRGNTLMTCRPDSTSWVSSGTGSACAAVQDGTAKGHNNFFDMTYVDVDSDVDTFNSSSATLTIPDGATVLYAGLSWAGRTSAGSLSSGGSTYLQGVAAPNRNARGTALFKVAGAATNTTVTSTTTDVNGSNYQAYVDVTDAVKTAGSGVYTMANVQAGTGANSYAGWSLTVAYAEASLPERNLVVYTGYNTVDNGAPQDITVSGFTTPASGSFVTRVGTVGYEGDYAVKGDGISLNGTPLANTLNPVNDMFNSSLTDLNAAITDTTPSYRNLLGIDVDRFDASGILANASTSATINLNTTGDTFYPGLITFATDLNAATLTGTKTVTDVNGGNVSRNDRLNYSIVVTNTGADASISTVLTDAIPVGTTYVPGSLKINSTNISDVAGDDAGEVVAANVITRLGTDATTSAGGRLAVSGSVTVVFGVTVNPSITDGAALTNTAVFSYNDETGLNGHSGASNTTSSSVVYPPTLTFAASMPDGTVGTAYSNQLTKIGGTGPFTWSVSAGSMPPGVTLDASTGLLSGTPTTAGSYPFTVRIVDANSRPDTKSGTVLIKLASSVALVSSDSSVTFGTSVTLTATITPSDATGTVTFTDVPASGTNQGDTVTLGTGTISSGVATLTLALPAFGANQVSAGYGGDGTHGTATSTAESVEVTGYAGEIIANEFRTSGPSGANDSYLELYNAGPPAPLAGFIVKSTSGTTVTVPEETGTLDTDRSYLLAGASFSLGAIATSNVPVPTLGSGGFQVLAPDTAGTQTDAVGPATGYHRGTALVEPAGTPSDDYAWVRLKAGGRPWTPVATSTTSTSSRPPGASWAACSQPLGSPSPTAIGNAYQHNSTLQSTPLDPDVFYSLSPNRDYTAGTAGGPGTLVVRRTITNSSPDPVNVVKLRITALSEANGAPKPGVGSQPVNIAHLRVVNPGTPTSSVPVTTGGPVTVQNLSVDTPADRRPRRRPEHHADGAAAQRPTGHRRHRQHRHHPRRRHHRKLLARLQRRRQIRPGMSRRQALSSRA